jgi:hypothetical protein
MSAALAGPPGALNFAEAPISNLALVNSTCGGLLCEDY